MTSNAIPRKELFTASCLSLLVTSLSFGIRAGILGQLGAQFNLNATELGTITATAFWGFPIAVVIGGFIVDIIGMKRLLEMALFFIWRVLFLRSQRPATGHYFFPHCLSALQTELLRQPVIRSLLPSFLKIKPPSLITFISGSREELSSGHLLCSE